MTPKILVFAGSNRPGSHSKTLAQAAVKTLALMEAEVTVIGLADYPLPVIDEDMDTQRGIPENAVRLARMFAARDGMFVACPEYNASIAPLLKNAIDWVSMVRSDGTRPVRPFEGIAVALGSASDDQFGGIRCLGHLREVLVAVGAQVVSRQCVIPFAGEAFGEDGMLSADRESAMLEKTCRELIDYCTPGRGR